MKFTRKILPLQLTPITMAVYELAYAPGSITEREPEQVQQINKCAAWKIHNRQIPKGKK